MADIEQIKHDGEVKALKDELNDLRFDLTNSIWNGGIMANGTYTRLGHILDRGEFIIKEMREVFAALQEIEPENK